MSEHHTQDALRSVAEHFADLSRVLDNAETQARRLDDAMMATRLGRAKSSAERGIQLIARLRDMAANDEGDVQASRA